MDLKEYQYISDYLENKLNATERLEFENRLKSDKDFKETYLMYCANDLAIIENYKTERLREFKEIQLTDSKKRPRSQMRYLYIGLSAAATILLLITFWNINITNQFTSGEQIASNLYAAHSPDWNVTREIGTGSYSGIYQQMNNLENSSDKELEILIQSLDSKDIDLKNYYLGHIYFRLNEYDASIRNFELLINQIDKNHRINEFAEFYLLLAYEANGKLKLKEELKSKILDDSGVRHRFYEIVKQSEL